MERSGSQKVLLVLSILNIILAAFVILASLLTIAGGALVGAVPAARRGGCRLACGDGFDPGPGIGGV